MERLARVEEALAELPAVAAAKERLAKKHKAGPAPVPRTSTTDPEARIMKMSDGGFRPAYNVQFATDHDSDVIVGVLVTPASSEHHELVPMLDQLEARLGASPATLLVDGGFVAQAAIHTATDRGCASWPPCRAVAGRPTRSR